MGEICVDLCALLRCCDWQYSLPDDCQAIVCDPCIFDRFDNVRIQDDRGSYIQSGDVRRTGNCSWECDMVDDPGGGFAGIASWLHSNVIPNWAYDFNGAFGPYSYRSDPYTSADGCSLEMSLLPQQAGGISWLMNSSGRLSDDAILP